MFAVPVGVLLKGAGGTDDGKVVAGFRDELQSDGKIVISESAGHRKRGQSTKIPDAAERIGESKVSFQIGVERIGAERL